MPRILVGVIESMMAAGGAGSAICVAGSPTFVEPICRGIVMVSACQDAAEASTADN
jgi:hypothetical protein